MSGVPRHGVVIHWLYYVMDVTRAPPRMRPQADVYLIRMGQFGHDARRPVQERSHRHRLFSGEICHVNDVTFGLHDEGPDTERADTVLYHPARFSGNDSPRQHGTAAGEVARHTRFHDRNSRSLCSVL